MRLPWNVGVAGALAKELIDRLVHDQGGARTPSRTPLGADKSAKFKYIYRNISINNAKSVIGEPFARIHLILAGEAREMVEFARNHFQGEEYRFVSFLYRSFDTKRDV